MEATSGGHWGGRKQVKVGCLPGGENPLGPVSPSLAGLLVGSGADLKET